MTGVVFANLANLLTLDAHAAAAPQAPPPEEESTFFLKGLRNWVSHLAPSWLSPASSAPSSRISLEHAQVCCCLGCGCHASTSAAQMSCIGQASGSDVHGSCLCIVLLTASLSVLQCIPWWRHVLHHRGLQVSQQVLWAKAQASLCGSQGFQDHINVSHTDIDYANLAGPDPVPFRSHVYVCTTQLHRSLYAQLAFEAHAHLGLGRPWITHGHGPHNLTLAFPCTAQDWDARSEAMVQLHGGRVPPGALTPEQRRDRRWVAAALLQQLPLLRHAQVRPCWCPRELLIASCSGWTCQTCSHDVAVRLALSSLFGVALLVPCGWSVWVRTSKSLISCGGIAMPAFIRRPDRRHWWQVIPCDFWHPAPWGQPRAGSLPPDGSDDEPEPKRMHLDRAVETGAA